MGSSLALVSEPEAAGSGGPDSSVGDLCPDGSGGAEWRVAFVAAARRPTGGNHGDGHAAAACGAKARWIQGAPTARAVAGWFAAAGAVRGHGDGQWAEADGRMVTGRIAGGRIAIRRMVTGLRWRR